MAMILKVPHSLGDECPPHLGSRRQYDRACDLQDAAIFTDPKYLAAARAFRYPLDRAGVVAELAIRGVRTNERELSVIGDILALTLRWMGRNVLLLPHQVDEVGEWLLSQGEHNLTSSAVARRSVGLSFESFVDEEAEKYGRGRANLERLAALVSPNERISESWLFDLWLLIPTGFARPHLWGELELREMLAAVRADHERAGVRVRALAGGGS